MRNLTPWLRPVSCVIAVAMPVPFALAEEERLVLEEVLVTATHRELSAQDVAASLSAISEEQLRALRIRRVDDLQNFVPGLFVRTQSIGNTRYTIRGVGAAVDDISVESGVAVYIDGVYVPRAGPANGLLFDLDRVEVLRGPQGTLYGRNSAGGAINYITRRPSHEPGAEFSVEVAEYDTFNAKAYLTGPLVEDKVLGKLSVVSMESDGYMENVFNGDDGTGEDTQAIRAGVDVMINDDIELQLTLDYQENDPNPRMFALLEPGFRSVIHDLTPGYPSEPAGEDPYEANLDNTGFESMDTGGITLQLNTAGDNVDTVYLFGYRESETRFSADRDHSPENLFNENHDEDSDWWSGEIRLTSRREGDWSFGGKADWLLGLYYFEEEGTRDAVFTSEVFELFFPGELPFSEAQLGFNQGIETEAFAVFGELTHDLGDHARATLGVRYTYEEKTFSGSTFIDDPTRDLFFPGFPGLIPPGQNGGLIDDIYDVTTGESWDDVAFKFGLEYDLNDSVLAYFLFSQGFKSGGFQGTAPTEAIARTPFDPENVDNFELGLKGSYFDGRLQSNMSVYYMDYRDLQSGIARDTATPVTLNADAEIMGFEWDLVGLPAAGLQLGLSVGYIDSEYTEFEGTPALEGEQVNGVPEYKYSLFADYGFPLAGGDLTLHADYVWQDDTTDGFGNAEIADWDVLNASITYRSPREHWELVAWVRNLLDEEYWLENSLASVTAPDEATPRLMAAPRIIGATINYRLGGLR